VKQARTALPAPLAFPLLLCEGEKRVFATAKAGGGRKEGEAGKDCPACPSSPRLLFPEGGNVITQLCALRGYCDGEQGGRGKGESGGGEWQVCPSRAPAVSYGTKVAVLGMAGV
jgi:hypothetical protein